jgi:hypothetical protein
MLSSKDTNYHRFLRVSVLVMAFVLIFESGLLVRSSGTVANNVREYLVGAVGMTASVQPTELNQYTAALTQKEQELRDREAALMQREISSGLNEGSTTNSQVSTYLLASILFILLVLILLNYALDFLRSREQRYTQTV